MGTFTSAGIGHNTKQRILDFLNCALVAEDIAGSEPESGPIYDDPSIGRPSGYDIGITVAQRILDRRAELPGAKFTDLSQLSNIRGLGKDKFADLIYSFGPAFFTGYQVAYVNNDGKIVTHWLTEYEGSLHSESHTVHDDPFKYGPSISCNRATPQTLLVFFREVVNENFLGESYVLSVKLGKSESWLSEYESGQGITGIGRVSPKSAPSSGFVGQDMYLIAWSQMMDPTTNDWGIATVWFFPEVTNYSRFQNVGVYEYAYGPAVACQDDKIWMVATGLGHRIVLRVGWLEDTGNTRVFTWGSFMAVELPDPPALESYYDGNEEVKRYWVHTRLGIAVAGSNDDLSLFLLVYRDIQYSREWNGVHGEPGKTFIYRRPPNGEFEEIGTIQNSARSPYLAMTFSDDALWVFVPPIDSVGGAVYRFADDNTEVSSWLSVFGTTDVDDRQGLSLSYSSIGA
ncbi:hypothetical protein ES703_113892 [subsurface metagenome]